MVAEVTIKISRREVAPQLQALWDQGLNTECIYHKNKKLLFLYILS